LLGATKTITLVRVRDASSPELARFGGRRWLPVDEDYRIEGVFTPYDPPKPLAITNLLGDTSTPTSPGVVSFTLGGKAQQLDATGWREGGLVLHFRDVTKGELTYGGGRAVVTAPPTNGLVTVDFNRASNLPCAFTEFATCPLPPAQKWNVHVGHGRRELSDPRPRCSTSHCPPAGACAGAGRRG